MTNTVAHSRTYATSLLKGIRILEQFSAKRRELGVGELSDAVGAAKSTVSRIARTLEREGFLTRDSITARYRLGLKLWELGCLAIDDDHGFSTRARTYLETLVELTNESAHAVIRDGADVIYVDKVDGLRSVRTFMSLGARFPAHCTASGRALLAFCSDDDIDNVIGHGLKPHSSLTETDEERLRAELSRVRSRGYAINRGEWRKDIGGIAAPVRSRNGQVIGALGITLPLSRFPRNQETPLMRSVVDTARLLSRELGYIVSHDEEPDTSVPAAPKRTQRRSKRQSTSTNKRRTT